MKPQKWFLLFIELTLTRVILGKWSNHPHKLPVENKKTFFFNSFPFSTTIYRIRWLRNKSRLRFSSVRFIDEDTMSVNAQLSVAVAAVFLFLFFFHSCGRYRGAVYGHRTNTGGAIYGSAFFR